MGEQKVIREGWRDSQRGSLPGARRKRALTERGVRRRPGGEWTGTPSCDGVGFRALVFGGGEGRGGDEGGRKKQACGGRKKSKRRERGRKPPHMSCSCSSTWPTGNGARYSSAGVGLLLSALGICSNYSLNGKFIYTNRPCKLIFQI